MKFLAIAINHEHGCSVSNYFTQPNDQNINDFKEMIRSKLAEEIGGEVDEIFILPCVDIEYHYTQENGWK